MKCNVTDFVETLGVARRAHQEWEMEESASHHVALKIYHLVLASTSGFQKHLGQILQVWMLKDNEEIPMPP